MTDGPGPGGAARDLPAGIRQRRTWRSPLRRTVDALLLGVERRTGSMVDVVAGHTAWHEALSRRAEPWSGWTALTIGRATAVPTGASSRTPAGNGTRPAADRGPAGPPPETATSAAAGTRPAGTRPARAGTRPPTASPDPSSPVASARRSADRVRRPVPAPARPGVRLAGSEAPSGLPAGTGSDRTGRPPVAAGTAPGGVTPTAGAPPARAGLVRAVPSSPRREVVGGFPARRATPEGRPSHPRSRSPAPETSLPGPPVLPAAAPPRGLPALPATNEGDRHPLTSPGPGGPLASQPPPPPDTRSVIEQLVDGTRLPAPLPGLEVRILGSGQRSAGDAAARLDPPGPPPAREEAQRQVPAAPASLDVEALTERVYQALQRRQQFERERRGLY